MAKLSPADRIEIRRLYGNGGYSYGDLAKQFRVGRTAISDTIHGNYKPPEPNPKGNKRPKPVPQRAGNKTEHQNKKEQNEGLGKVEKPEPDPVKEARLDDGGKKQIQWVQKELDKLFKRQASDLEELQLQEDAYKSTLMDDSLRDRIAMRAFAKQGVTKYSALGPDAKEVVDGLLPKYRFDELWLVHNKMSMALIGIKDTLGRMSQLQRSLVLNFNMDTTVVLVEQKVEASINLVLKEVVFKVLTDRLPNKVAEPLIADMDRLMKEKEGRLNKLLQEDV